MHTYSRWLILFTVSTLFWVGCKRNTATSFVIPTPYIDVPQELINLLEEQVLSDLQGGPPIPDLNAYACFSDPEQDAAFEEAQVRAFAALIASPQTQTLDAADFVAIYGHALTELYGGRVESPFALDGSNDTFLVTFPKLCRVGAHDDSPDPSYVIDRSGAFSEIEPIANIADYYALPNGWVLSVYTGPNGHGSDKGEVRHVHKAQDGWKNQVLFSSTGTAEYGFGNPTVALSDDLQSLTIEYTSWHHSPPCKLRYDLYPPYYATTTDVYLTYQWDGTTYELSNEEIAITEMWLQDLNADEGDPNASKKIRGWERYCIKP